MAVDQVLVEKAFLIRHFEERLLSLFVQGKLNGTVHTCIGQEWSAIAIGEALRPQDVLFSNHRGHGHFLARNEDLDGLISEVMGRSSGVCGGIGGTQHLFASNHYSNGVQGGMVPVAAGYALGQKLSGSDFISMVCVGDGTMGEGVLYESLNLMSKWELPIIVLVENNGYAQSTATATTMAGTIEGRAQAFGIHFRSGSTNCYEDLLETVKSAVDWCRMERRPVLIEIQTSRLNAHSKGDDNRDSQEIYELRSRDPLNRFAIANQELHQSILKGHQLLIDKAERKALDAPPCRYSPPILPNTSSPKWKVSADGCDKRYSELLYSAFDHALSEDSRLIFIGEDIEGPYGGAFKVTRDLSQKHPGRVRNTPISEAAIVGLGSGLALSGHPAIVEIMFGDFLSLTFDQIYQHSAKFHALFNEKVRVPLVIRTPMGGRRGYGPTHSQSIEKHFLGIPGLDVFALNHRVNPIEFYRALLQDRDQPALVIENKILYTRTNNQPIPRGYILELTDEPFPTVRLRPQDQARAQVTIACYGGILEEVEAALEPLFYEEEILCEVICPARLSPMDASLPALLGSTGKLFIVEEGCNEVAWSSEVVAQTVEKMPIQVKRMSYNGIIPACFSLEQGLLPNRNSIFRGIKEFV